MVRKLSPSASRNMQPAIGMGFVVQRVPLGYRKIELLKLGY